MWELMRDPDSHYKYGRFWSKFNVQPPCLPNEQHPLVTVTTRLPQYRDRWPQLCDLQRGRRPQWLRNTVIGMTTKFSVSLSLIYLYYLTPPSIEMQIKSWTSKCYGHFQMPPTIIKRNDGTILYQFTCKRYATIHQWLQSLIVLQRYPSITLTRRRDEVSTGNLLRHITDCEPENTAESTQMERFAHACTYSHEAFRYLLVKWVTSCSRPYSIIEDAPLKDIFKMLYNKTRIVAADTISRDVQLIFKNSRGAIIETLKVFILTILFFFFKLIEILGAPWCNTSILWWVVITECLFISRCYRTLV